MKRIHSLRYRVNEISPNPFKMGIYKGQTLTLSIEADEPINTTYRVVTIHSI